MTGACSTASLVLRSGAPWRDLPGLDRGNTLGNRVALASAARKRNGAARFAESRHAAHDRLLLLPVEPLGLYRPPPVHGDRRAAPGRGELQAGVPRAGVRADRRAALTAAPSGAAALPPRRPAALARKARRADQSPAQVLPLRCQ